MAISTVQIPLTGPSAGVAAAAAPTRVHTPRPRSRTAAPSGPSGFAKQGKAKQSKRTKTMAYAHRFAETPMYLKVYPPANFLYKMVMPVPRNKPFFYRAFLLISWIPEPVPHHFIEMDLGVSIL